jgi:hypothetical protein
MSAMQVLARYNIMGLGLGLGVASMAQTRNDSVPGPNLMQQPPQHVQNMPTQRYDMTQSLMPPGNGMSNLLDTSDNRHQDVSFCFPVLVHLSCNTNTGSMAPLFSCTSNLLPPSLLHCF